MSSRQLPPGHPLAKATQPVAWSEFRYTSNEEQESRTVQAKDPYKLDFLFFNELVQYKCSCESYRRLNVTYFCRHCMALRCRSCVAHEVDSQYCQHCLEYIPTIDPKFQMNKCASCYQCPECLHLLSTSILSITPANSDQQQLQQPSDEVIKRTCQLVCEFCRWSSPTFTIEGSRITNNLDDVKIGNSNRIAELMNYYKATSHKEKTDKKKRRFHSRSGNTMDLLKKYGIDNTLSPKLFESLRARTNFHDKNSPSARYNLEPNSGEDSSIDEFKPAEARPVEELEKLDTDFYYSKDFNLENISSISQRLAQVELQPTKKEDFKPISKSLSVKRSLRCTECERNLCRSEYSPVSTRFKIQSAAYYHVPELKLRASSYPIKTKLNEDNIIEFTLQNQTLSNVRVKLDKILDEEQDKSYDIDLPPNELSIGPKDDTVDYEHVPLGLRPLNEETQVMFQSPFKIGFYIKIRPKIVTENLRISFRLSHDVTLLQNPRDNDKIERVHQTVRVTLGPVE